MTPAPVQYPQIQVPILTLDPPPLGHQGSLACGPQPPAALSWFTFSSSETAAAQAASPRRGAFRWLALLFLLPPPRMLAAMHSLLPASPPRMLAAMHTRPPTHGRTLAAHRSGHTVPFCCSATALAPRPLPCRFFPRVSFFSTLLFATHSPSFWFLVPACVAMTGPAPTSSLTHHRCCDAAPP